MARGAISKGQCIYCGALIAKTSASRHLAVCPQRLTAVEKANQSGAPAQTLFYLRAQDAWRKEFWIDLEVPGSATLNDIDHYLRAIWLECCGHLSRFSIGGWGSDEIPMGRRIKDVFEPGLTLTHIYDFGTSSQTLVKAIGTREGKPMSRRPVELMIRNLMPDYVCSECGQPATMLCMECLIEHNEFGALCDAHAADHPHTDYGEPIALVNSPRLGMCGYSGPAEPPY